MFSKSSWLHLRIPFSYFLLPVFLFSLSVSPNISEQPLLWTFLIIHLLLYPASNGFNSYFDKDEKSIGGLKNPPPVNRGLYYLALVFDVAAIVLAIWKVSFDFALMLFVYSAVSRAYSHPWIRLKKYAFASWFIAGLFQGAFTFMMCYMGVNKYEFMQTMKPTILIPAFLSSALLWGSYPMTQVYQHEEDAKRGDKTLSLSLGIKGTFWFVMVMFSLASLGYTLYFYHYFSWLYAQTFLLAMSPVVLFFLFWFYQVSKDENKADYKRTMWLNFISATCLNAFFIYLFLSSSHILDAL
ncbi:ubiquinone biosynthesis protein UbiA [Chryseotalea sanaruensis]|uniref:Ubiquinone biosynthesis protein UbiA n=1 Tax=Chryseotalea sanaruensis TaxID=2482724 RepID=A0A401U8B0_9BACT|nr:UbiA family prenyltransferase [Chryseotalea sanaruensis]GCC51116.1 ubiquinone biosynthesis protein UbiA [Chryseotalea sanaruensis]